MKLDYGTYEYIKSEAANMFLKYNVSQIPINGIDIAKKMGIILIKYSSLNSKKLNAAKQVSEDAFYLEIDNKEYIYYNENKNSGRMNMNILHEIGHCMLGHGSYMKSDLAEAEANFFAKYVIAPPPLVDIFNPKNPEDIRKHFSISYEAACNSFSYYNTWLSHRNVTKKYEVDLLENFKVTI